MKRRALYVSFGSVLKVTLRISNDTSPLPDLVEKNRYRCCGSFNSPRCIRARDTDSWPNCIWSYYDLPDTPKAALRTEPMDLPETHHGATCRALNDDPRAPRLSFISESRRIFHKVYFVTVPFWLANSLIYF